LAHSDYTLDKSPDRRQQRIWNNVSRSPLRSLWNLKGIPIRVVAQRTWRALLADNLLGRAAELAFYFLFALFPTLFSASSILGLAARSASEIYDNLLRYLALVVPTSALGTVIATFNETTAAASSRKLTFGLIAAIWSASVGVSAIQDALNAVYKVHDERSYIRARISAIGITIVLSVLATLTLTCMFGSDFLVALLHARIANPILATALAVITRIIAWVCATAMLSLSFAVIYYWAPGVKTRCWRWLTPGGAVAMFFWLISSLGFRVYLHFFNSYSLTYGSLGAVITLLMWFYLSGFMLLLGAEINSEIEAAAAEKKLSGHKRSAETPPIVSMVSPSLISPSPIQSVPPSESSLGPGSG
jgi:membrane protein